MELCIHLDREPCLHLTQARQHTHLQPRKQLQPCNFKLVKCREIQDLRISSPILRIREKIPDRTSLSYLIFPSYPFPIYSPLGNDVPSSVTICHYLKEVGVFVTLPKLYVFWFLSPDSPWGDGNSTTFCSPQLQPFSLSHLGIRVYGFLSCPKMPPSSI